MFGELNVLTYVIGVGFALYFAGKCIENTKLFDNSVFMPAMYLMFAVSMLVFMAFV